MTNAVEENLDVLRRAFAALNNRDLDELMSYYTEDVIFDGSRVMEGVQEGKATWREVNEEVIARTDIHQQNLSFLTAGDRIVVLADVSGKGAASGIQVEGRLAYLYEFRGGLISRVEAHPDPEALLHSLGFEE